MISGLAEGRISLSEIIEDSRHQIVMDKRHRAGYNIGQQGRGTLHKQIEAHSEGNVPKREETTMSYGQLYDMSRTRASNITLHVNECHMTLLQHVVGLSSANSFRQVDVLHGTRQ
jgi:hypothetical protein